MLAHQNIILSTLLERGAHTTLLERDAQAPQVLPTDTATACLGVTCDSTPRGDMRQHAAEEQSSRHHASVLGGNPVALNGTPRGLHDPRDPWRQSCHASRSVG